MNKIFTVSPSPHIHGKDSTARVMRDVLIALVPAFGVSLWVYGMGALIITATAVAACVLFEALIQKYLLGGRSTIRDCSAVLTGVLLGFNLPSNLPVWMVVIGALVAIGVGKMSFGGLGRNLFNPALVGRVFLLISFPVYMTSFPQPANVAPLTVFAATAASGATMASGATAATGATVESGATIVSGATGVYEAADASGAMAETAAKAVDATSGPTLLAWAKSTIAGGGTTADLTGQLDYFGMLFGFRSGSLGEIAALALLIGLAYLLFRKVITWHIPVAVLGSMFLFSGILWVADPLHYINPVFHILTGGALLGAIFMATDYVTSPMTHKGMIVYGIGIGIITILIRVWGAYPEGVSFAILIMNATVPLIDKYMRPKVFGSVKPAKT